MKYTALWPRIFYSYKCIGFFFIFSRVKFTMWVQRWHNITQNALLYCIYFFPRILVFKCFTFFFLLINILHIKIRPKIWLRLRLWNDDEKVYGVCAGVEASLPVRGARGKFLKPPPQRDIESTHRWCLSAYNHGDPHFLFMARSRLEIDRCFINTTVWLWPGEI